jgi:hypothetical protein
MSATVPFLDLTVGGSVDTQLPGGGTAMIRRSDSASGLGDIVLMPLMFNQLFSPSLSVNYRLAVYAPTGDYETGRLANTGKNFWTYEPIVAVVYFGQQTGFEASAFLGVSFNDRNSATDYDSGNQAHIEGTVAWHRPRWGGVAGFGVTGFAYQQISDDSGPGATFGDFRASTNGIGPVMSYIRNVDDSQLLVEGKWLHEFGVENRPEGDTLFVKVMWKF